MDELITHRVYEFADFQVDASQRLLRSSGRPLPLSPRAFDALLYFVEHPLAERLPGVEVISRTTMTSARFKAQPVAVIVSAKRVKPD